MYLLHLFIYYMKCNYYAEPPSPTPTNFCPPHCAVLLYFHRIWQWIYYARA